MGTQSRPNSDYTKTWCPSGEIEDATLADGTRLRYLKAGSGPVLILLHTVRTQLDHFQLVIPKLVHAFTVFAIDFPGMGWSDITPGASYSEPALRRAIVEFVKTLDLDDVTLAGESMGATVSLTASTELEDRVRRIVAFNTYDYPGGVGRANLVASIYVGGARLPAIGPMVAKMENKPALGIVLRGGLVDGSRLPDHYLGELRLVGRRRGYPRVAREVYRNVDSMIAARALYSRVTAPVTLIYGDHDWSRIPEREANHSLLPGARSISLPQTGHFAALEQPARVAEILLDNHSDIIPAMARAVKASPAGTSLSTIGSLWQQGVDAGRSRAAFLVKEGSGWREVSWSEAADRVTALANGFLAMDVVKGDKVAILCRTRLEWTLADYALATIGAVVIPIYPTSSPAEIEHILADSEAEMLVAEDAEQLAKGEEFEIELPALEKVVGIDVTGKNGTLADVEAAGRAYAEQHPDALAHAAAQVGLDDTLTFLYTSGTTGPPKGCVLSQRNYASMVASVQHVDDLFRDDDTLLLFLPLSHNYARLVQFLGASVGFTLAFCSDVREVSAALQEVKPTLFPSVPRIYEKLHAAVLSAAAETGGMKQRLAEWAFRVGTRKAKEGGGGLQLWLADKLVLGKVRARMGGRMRYAISGGAPLAPEIAAFFAGCGLTILEGYGMTECTTAATMNRPKGHRIGTVGPALPGIELKIEEDGEILIRGENVFTGYYRDPAATAETLTEDGWLRSGDIGVIDGDGYLRITDRKKDILVTAGGKNVSPQVIENALNASPYISQSLVVGDNRPYITALITVDRDKVKSLGAPDGPEVRAAIEKVVATVNEDLGRVEQIKRFAILPRDFTAGEGEVTPTLKLKRKILIEHFHDEVEGLYAAADG